MQEGLRMVLICSSRVLSVQCTWKTKASIQCFHYRKIPGNLIYLLAHQGTLLQWWQCRDMRVGYPAECGVLKSGLYWRVGNTGELTILESGVYSSLLHRSHNPLTSSSLPSSLLLPFPVSSSVRLPFLNSTYECVRSSELVFLCSISLSVPYHFNIRWECRVFWFPTLLGDRFRKFSSTLNGFLIIILYMIPNIISVCTSFCKFWATILSKNHKSTVSYSALKLSKGQDIECFAS